MMKLVLASNILDQRDDDVYIYGSPCIEPTILLHFLVVIHDSGAVKGDLFKISRTKTSRCAETTDDV